MRFHRRFFSLLIPVASWIGLAVFPAPAAEAQRHFPTNEEIRQVRTASAPRLSPDGKHVVVEITDSTANGESHLASFRGRDRIPATDLFEHRRRKRR
jgi:hypothetical protein